MTPDGLDDVEHRAGLLQFVEHLLGIARALLHAANGEGDDHRPAGLTLDLLARRFVDALDELAAVVGRPALSQPAERVRERAEISRVVGQLQHLAGHRADRELGLALQPLDEAGDAQTEDPAAVVVHDQRDVHRRRRLLGRDDRHGLVVLLDDELVGLQVREDGLVRADGVDIHRVRRGLGRGERGTGERGRQREDEQSIHGGSVSAHSIAFSGPGRAWGRAR